ncbi:MAG: alpha/beta fold hydrolase [Bacteroidota bacterium]
MNKFHIVITFCVATVCFFTPKFLRAQLLPPQVDTLITMSDGIKLDATITFPLGNPPSGGFPAVVLVHGYGGNKTQMQPLALLLALDGYASLAYSVRGQGNSGGVSTTLGEREKEDLYEVIQFLRDYPKINRENLGVAGGSQGGIHSWMAAVYRMPGVKAVAPSIATPNFANDLVPNGCVKKGLAYELSLDGDVNYSPERDRVRDFILHDLYDSIRAYTEARDLEHLLDNVQIPVIQALGWRDVLFSVNGGIRAAKNLASRSIPVWSYYGANGHGDPVDTSEVLFVAGKMIQWFDHWIKAKPLDSAGLPVVYYSDDRPGWSHHLSNGWPPQGSSTLRLFPIANGLSAYAPSQADSFLFSLEYDSTYTPEMGWQQLYGGPEFARAFRSYPVRFVSPPVRDSTEITGIPRAHLVVSSDAPRFQSHVRIYDVAPSDTGLDWQLIARGTYGIRINQPGDVHEVEFECNALSHILPPGHMVGLEVTSLDLLQAQAAYVIPYFLTSHSRLLTSPVSPSYVDLPIVNGIQLVAVQDVFKPLPQEFVLYQNYPNPFSSRGVYAYGGNSTTMIEFVVPKLQSIEKPHVCLTVYDILGRKVAVLVDEPLSAGVHRVAFDGSGLASGVYVYRLTASGAGVPIDISLTRRMLLLK